MNRWEMLDKVITKFGFEVEETIEFAFFVKMEQINKSQKLLKV